jgi:hypothetical protein
VRGVRFAHALYPQHEMEAVATEEAGRPLAEISPALPPGEISQLRSRVAELESRLARVESFLNKDLGASFPATEGAPRGATEGASNHEED